jgi:hypothetical protein
VYRGAPHGMPATFKDHINADLLAFFLRQRAGGSVVHGTEDVEMATTLTASGPTIVASQRARRRGRSIHSVT